MSEASSTCKVDSEELGKKIKGILMSDGREIEMDDDTRKRLEGLKAMTELSDKVTLIPEDARIIQKLHKQADAMR